MANPSLQFPLPPLLPYQMGNLQKLISKPALSLRSLMSGWKSSTMLYLCFLISLLVFQTTPGVQKRYFRQVKNLIAAFQKPGQGIAMPLLYPVTAQRRAQTHTEAPEPSNSLSPTHSNLNSYSQQTPHPAQGQNNMKVRQALKGKPWTQLCNRMLPSHDAYCCVLHVACKHKCHLTVSLHLSCFVLDEAHAKCFVTFRAVM